jgi:hypothetical protein
VPEVLAHADPDADAQLRRRGPKEVASRIRRRLTQCYAYTDPDSDQAISYEAVCELVKAGARAPVEHICAISGGVFLPGQPTTETTDALVARCAREHGEFIAAFIGKAGTIETIRELDDLIRCAAAVRAAKVAELEAGK